MRSYDQKILTNKRVVTPSQNEGDSDFNSAAENIEAVGEYD